MKNQRAFSLIELLCAMLLGLIILTLMMDAFLGYRRNFQLNQAIAEMQENARFAIHFLKEEVGLAGYLGCAKLTKELLIENEGVDRNAEIHFFNALNVYNQVISVRHLSSKVGFLQAPASKTNTITLGLKPTFNRGDSIAIAEINKVVLAQVDSVDRSLKNHIQRLTLTRSFKQSFAIGAEVRELVHSTFFIQSTARKNRSGHIIFALYQKESAGKNQELVSGIDLLRVICFLKNGERVTPDNVHCWDQVKLLKISLLMSSDDEVLDYRKSYWLDGVKIKPSDKRLYQEIVFYVRVNE